MAKAPNAYSLCVASQFTQCNDRDPDHSLPLGRVCLADWLDGWRPVYADPTAAVNVGRQGESNRPVGHKFEKCGNDKCEYCNGKSELAVPRDFVPATTTYVILLADGTKEEITLTSPNDAQDDAKAEIYRRWGWKGFLSYYAKSTPDTPIETHS